MRVGSPEAIALGIEPECCAVVDVGCEAPAGYLNGDEVEDGDETAEFICDLCGDSVCGNCSRALADSRRACSYCAEGERLAPEEYRPLPPAQPGGAKVMAKMCGTCVFGPKSPLGAHRLRDLEQQWQVKDVHQTCHHAGVGEYGDDDDSMDAMTIDGEDIVCHGFFREVFLRNGTGQLLRISERLGGFEYIDPAEYPLEAAR